jgi:hypothetical protein
LVKAELFKERKRKLMVETQRGSSCVLGRGEAQM